MRGGEFAASDLLDHLPLERLTVSYCCTHFEFFPFQSDTLYQDKTNATDTDELYDLDADPGEINNLIHSGFAQELSRLRGRLIHWMEKEKDTMLNPWTRRTLEEGRKAI